MTYNARPPTHRRLGDPALRSTAPPALLGSDTTGVSLLATAPTVAHAAVKASGPGTPKAAVGAGWLPAERRLTLELVDVAYDGPPSVGFNVRGGPWPGASRIGYAYQFGLRHGYHTHKSMSGQRFMTTVSPERGVGDRSIATERRAFDLLTPGPNADGGPSPRRAGGAKIGGFKVSVQGAGFYRASRWRCRHQPGFLEQRCRGAHGVALMPTSKSPTRVGSRLQLFTYRLSRFWNIVI